VNGSGDVTRASVGRSFGESSFYSRAIDESCFWGYKNVVSIAFDPDKEARNIRKHGISLTRAEEIDMAAAGCS
jgi:hypothetical protein